MNRVFEDFSYDMGPESLPCHNLNNNNNNFQSKYLFFNGLGATLPRRPKKDLNSRKANAEVQDFKSRLKPKFLLHSEKIMRYIGEHSYNLITGLIYVQLLLWYDQSRLLDGDKAGGCIMIIKYYPLFVLPPLPSESSHDSDRAPV